MKAFMLFCGNTFQDQNVKISAICMKLSSLHTEGSDTLTLLNLKCLL